MQPEAGSQESSVQGLLSLQVSAVPAWHVPPEHVSEPLQAFPSSQELVSSLVYTQPETGSHESSVQGLPSSQVSEAPLTHEPAEHVSNPLHTFPSPQAFVSSLV